MKTITFNIVKINRLWIEAKAGSYTCKIKISDNTLSLKEGDEVSLLVEDISIRSKYGTELRYDAKPQSNEKVFLQASYNSDLVARCRKLGGQWDADAKVWVFDAIVAKEVELLEELYCSDLVNIEIKVKKDGAWAYQEPLRFLGYTLCTATGRDSGAKLADGIALMCGIINSSGSMKNWSTVARAGAVFRLSIPCNLLRDCATADIEDFFEVTIL